ncbi:hypothetical protein J6590_037171 [Homalodisca vitripennis]|nr:hypothetical protein J6590_037171 [Homalodisca vitripennis]
MPLEYHRCHLKETSTFEGKSAKLHIDKMIIFQDAVVDDLSLDSLDESGEEEVVRGWDLHQCHPDNCEYVKIGHEVEV